MRIFILLSFLLVCNILFAQNSYAPLGTIDYHIIDRLEIKNGRLSNAIFTSLKPYRRKDIVEMLNHIDTTLTWSKQDQFNITFLNASNNLLSNSKDCISKKALLKNVYRSKSAFYEVNKKDFSLKINPVLYLQGGKEKGVGEFKYINTRGIELSGSIDNKIGFYTFLSDNQAFHPTYINNKIATDEAVPGIGFYKSFHKTGFDYFNARGFIDFNITKHINIQLGQGNNFIGDGYRSLFLSAYANNYLFLKINTKVWKFQYQNLFTELTKQYNRGADTLLPKKYMTMHKLSYNATKWLNLGVFETVVFGRNNGFEFQYLNPIIFYRAIEQNLGSPDNAFIGLDFKANFLHHFSAYGQFLLDEFNLNQVKDSTGWWGNKWATQLGIKYIDIAGIKNLDGQLELNIVRPYTYTHNKIISNYTHYNQPLAHPLGANFKELIAILRYQPINRLNILAKLIYNISGSDTGSSNVGSNIFLNNTSRDNDYYNTIGQGIGTKLFIADLTISYHLKHNLFFDLRYRKRIFSDQMGINNLNTDYITFAMRLNIGQMNFDF